MTDAPFVLIQRHTDGETAPLQGQSPSHANAELSLQSIVTVRLNRPQQMNLLTRGMINALKEAIASLGADKTVGVIVLAAEGKAFCAGHDLKDMHGQPQPDVEELFASCAELMEQVRLCPKPVIAQVQGVAVAAGCQLVASCDLAMAADTARFGTTGIKAGLFCSSPMVPLSRLVSPKKALEMLMTGEVISAQVAEKNGLINHAVPGEALEAETLKLAAQIARHSQWALALGKSAFYQQLELPMKEAYDVGWRTMAHNAGAPDGQEGFAAFLEKRPPRYTQ